MTPKRLDQGYLKRHSKMGKAAPSRQKPRHDPLYKELTTQGGNLRTKARGAKKVERDEEAAEDYIDSTSSRKILQLAKEQQDEVEKEENRESKAQNNFSFGSRYIEQDDEEEEEDEENYENISDFGSDVEYDEFEVEEEVDERDAALFEMFLNKQGRSAETQAFNLGDKIMATLKAKEQEHEEEEQEKTIERPKDAVLLPPKVIAAYTQVGQILSTWTHGKLPKLFKVIPSLNNWQDVLYVTNPPEWTPHVVYEATKLFVSNLQSKQAERFVEDVLLERFRSDIKESETHSLNYHIYRALKKSLYKPGAFFKGFLFPLVETGCSVREATIAGSVLSKVSIPPLHSSVALNYLLNMDFSPPTTVFIRILIEKKYALPYQIIDNCVFYFMKFRLITDTSMMDEAEERDAKKQPLLPVVWHKAFLAFAQRYKNDITDDQRDFLLETVRQRNHKDISPEIRRELLAGTARQDPSAEKEEVMTDVF